MSDELALSLPPQTEENRLKRWRMVLGGGEADGIGIELGGIEENMDRALQSLYDPQRSGGLGGSAPYVARWLGDIRTYFPTSVVRVMQKDALEKLNLKQMLLQPELLEAVEPDVHLVSVLISLKSIIPAKTRDTARQVVRKVVEELEKKLAETTRQAILGALNRAERNRRPRYAEIDWQRTIRLNLKNYQPRYKTVIPEKRIGYSRKRTINLPQRTVILCVDQSGSMASSVVYSGIFGAVMASLRAVKTHMIVFDTSVVDLTDELSDPVDLLFGTQLGGGTDINRAVAYCQELIQHPSDTIFVLISDLYEGGRKEEMLKRLSSLIDSGVQVIALLALSDQGSPSYDADTAASLSKLGAPAFACTPDLFPELMAAAIQHHDIHQWAATNQVVLKG